MRVSIAVAAVIAAAVAVPLTSVEANAASSVRFSQVQYDSPGNDTGNNKSLNSEWAVITNHGNKARELTGWTIRDPRATSSSSRSSS